MHCKVFTSLIGVCSFVMCQTSNDSSTGNVGSSYLPVEQLQQRNLQILADNLPKGWKAFCESNVDEGVMSLYDGINPSDARIYVMTINNQSIELPIKSLSELRDFDIDARRKTLLYVNGYYTPDTYFNVLSHLKLLQATRRDLNIIIVDFVRDIQQLYYAVRRHADLQGYFVAKVLAVLVDKGVAPKDLTVAGHSVGANIAALGMTLYAEQIDDTKVGTLVAVDPAIMCYPADVFVRPNVTMRVVVIHGEGDIFGVREPLGTIDIYPNGVGYYTRRKLQPGCETSLCSHMYPFVLFMEALVEGVMIPAVKCDNWMQFRKRGCQYNDTVAIGLTYPERAAGLYFCLTQPSPPFTFMEHGLKYKRAYVKTVNV